jgi:hypothetical protein
MKLIVTAALSSQPVIVVTETNEDGARVMLTQGLNRSFKPRSEQSESFSPGRGIDTSGTYVAYPSAFSKGSFGHVRLTLGLTPSQMAVSPEQKQLGVSDLHESLRNEDGAVTVGHVSPSQIKQVEIYDYDTKRFVSMTPNEAITKLGVQSHRSLPDVNEYRNRLAPHADRLFLSPTKLEEVIHRYKMSPLSGKTMLADELDEIEQAHG